MKMLCCIFILSEHSRHVLALNFDASRVYEGFPCNNGKLLTNGCCMKQFCHVSSSLYLYFRFWHEKRNWGSYKKFSLKCSDYHLPWCTPICKCNGRGRDISGETMCHFLLRSAQVDPRCFAEHVGSLSEGWGTLPSRQHDSSQHVFGWRSSDFPINGRCYMGWEEAYVWPCVIFCAIQLLTQGQSHSRQEVVSARTKKSVTSCAKENPPIFLDTW